MTQSNSRNKSGYLFSESYRSYEIPCAASLLDSFDLCNPSVGCDNSEPSHNDIYQNHCHHARVENGVRRLGLSTSHRLVRVEIVHKASKTFQLIFQFKRLLVKKKRDLSFVKHPIATLRYPDNGSSPTNYLVGAAAAPEDVVSKTKRESACLIQLENQQEKAFTSFMFSKKKR